MNLVRRDFFKHPASEWDSRYGTGERAFPSPALWTSPAAAAARPAGREGPIGRLLPRPFVRRGDPFRQARSRRRISTG